MIKKSQASKMALLTLSTGILVSGLPQLPGAPIHAEASVKKQGIVTQGMTVRDYQEHLKRLSEVGDYRYYMTVQTSMASQYRSQFKSNDWFFLQEMTKFYEKKAAYGEVRKLNMAIESPNVYRIDSNRRYVTTADIQKLKTMSSKFSKTDAEYPYIQKTLENVEGFYAQKMATRLLSQSEKILFTPTEKKEFDGYVNKVRSEDKKFMVERFEQSQEKLRVRKTLVGMEIVRGIPDVQLISEVEKDVLELKDKSLQLKLKLELGKLKRSSRKISDLEIQTKLIQKAKSERIQTDELTPKGQRLILQEVKRMDKFSPGSAEPFIAYHYGERTTTKVEIAEEDRGFVLEDYLKLQEKLYSEFKLNGLVLPEYIYLEKLQQRTFLHSLDRAETLGIVPTQAEQVALMGLINSKDREGAEKGMANRMDKVLVTSEVSKLIYSYKKAYTPLPYEKAYIEKEIARVKDTTLRDNLLRSLNSR